jgi:integrase
MQEHTLLLKATKTKERYKNFMPLGDEGDTLFELIKRRWARRTYKKANGVTAISAYVFHRNGQPIGDIRKSWASTCKKAGLVEDNGGQVLQACETMSYTENKTETVPSKLFHDLRRTAVRDMLNAGVPWPTVKTITGHRTDSMLARYNIVVDSQKVEAIRQRMAWLVKRG